MHDGSNGSNGIDRRQFIGTMGAAAAGLLLARNSRINAQAQAYYYEDSFGNVVPAGDGALALGIYPPPITQPPPPDQGSDLVRHLGRYRPLDAPPPSGGGNSTFYASGYPIYNILLILVDQMRNPRLWVPAAVGANSGVQIVNSAIPNISALANNSFSFPNYFVAATVCGPSRASLLTGLYSQQHCIFKSAPYTGNSGNEAPSLLPYNNSWTPGDPLPGFPTIANALSQSLGVASNASLHVAYDCTWIGKWHLSCLSPTADGTLGQNGPSDYGFSKDYSLPAAAGVSSIYPGSASVGYPSPNGFDNTGVGGDFMDSYSQSTPARDVPYFGNNTNITGNTSYKPIANYVQLNDAAIADAFVNLWMPFAAMYRNNSLAGGQLTNPWFCAVSFLNPHDISEFPYPFGLATGNGTFGIPNNPSVHGYQPAPANNTSQALFYGNNCSGGNINCGPDGDVVITPGFSSPYANLPPGMGNSGPWNWEDLTAGNLQYTNNGKPGAQLAFLKMRDNICGSITSPAAYNNSSNSWQVPTPWVTFLNYYIWLQSCVDWQVGRVLDAIQTNSSFNNNTLIIFTSDHGDYAGSHGLHAKGGAVYDEVMNVPLYVSFPTMRSGSSGSPVTLPYVCSSVDLLPFIYYAALGNHSWRINSNDILYHLRNREAINDAIYTYNNSTSRVVQQHRLSTIPLHVGFNNCSIGNSACADWQLYQPFVLHTADDFATATIGSNNYSPSHVIAFRTADITDVNGNSAPFYPHSSYGGGKLGVYSFWDTCDAPSAPIKGIHGDDPDSKQYEFYNYSVHPHNGSLAPNPQETGNYYFDGMGGYSGQALDYKANFYSNNVQDELYTLTTGGGNSTLQVQSAIQIAFSRYLNYLSVNNLLTGNNGTPSC